MLYWDSNSASKGLIRLIRKLWIFVFCVFFLAASEIGAISGERVLDEKLDVKTLKTMAEKGQLIHLQYDEQGLLEYRMVCTLVNAPIEKVWHVLTDFENYKQFIPGMATPKVNKVSDNEYIVDFTLNIEIFGPIKSTQKYSIRYNPSQPYLYMSDPAKKRPPKNELDFWQLVKIDGGKRTLVFYLDKAPDLKELGNFVYGIVKEKPELALALQVSPVSIMVQEMKDYAERRFGNK